MPVRPLLCVMDGPTRGRAWSALSGPRRASPARRRGGRQTTFRAAPAAPRTRRRARPRGRLAECHPAPARALQPRHHQHLPAGHRHRGDHLDRSRTPSTDDVRDSGPTALKNPGAPWRGHRQRMLTPQAPGFRFLDANARRIGLLPGLQHAHRSSSAGSASLRTAATGESRSAKRVRRECC